MIPNKYDPRLKSTEELEATLINGDVLLHELLDFLRSNKGTLNNQSWIITGPRGIGKSHFLTLLARRINRDAELCQFWCPVLFPEEVFRIDSLYRLFQFILEKVFRIEEKKDQLPELYTRLNEIKKIRIPGNRKEKEEIQHRLAKESFTLLVELSKRKQKKFILMIENMQYLFDDQLSHQDLKDLRGFLNENPDVFIIIGTALTILDQFNHYEEPFYQYFRLRKMEPVDKKGIIDFLYRIADYWGHEIHKNITENKSCIYTYQILTDGNPRLVLFLYELLLDNDILNVDRILDKISELTPYFLDKTKEQSRLKTYILDALALEAPTQTATEIADYIQYDDMRSLASQLKRLVKEGWIKKIYFREELYTGVSNNKAAEREINKKECFYTLRDYFYRIWYKVRMGYNESQDIHCLSELTVFLFNKEEIQNRYKKYMGIDENKASFYSHSLDLLENESFMKNITLLLRESEKQVKLESIEYYAKIVKENPKDHEAWFNMGYYYAGLKKYEKSIECYQKIIESQTGSVTDLYTMLKYLSIDRLIEISPHVFFPSREMKNLLDENSALSIKILSLYRLLLLGKWIAVTDSFESLLKEKALLQENVHVLEFSLSAYIIHLLKQENRDQELLEVTRSWFSLVKIMYNENERKRVFLQFIYYTVDLINKEKLPLEKIETVMDEGKNSLFISPVLPILLRAVKNPITREAQKWMADPLFKTIVEKLNKP